MQLNIVVNPRITIIFCQLHINIIIIIMIGNNYNYKSVRTIANNVFQLRLC